MPICNKPPPQALASKSAAEIDDQASEAAKVKRTREQAYFNSYNFDAIEVLPYDEDNADEKSNKNRTMSSQQQHTHTVNIGDHENSTPSSALYQRSLPLHHVAATGVGGVVAVARLPPNASLSSSSRRSSSQSSSNDSYTHGLHQPLHLHNNSMQYTYLQRLGSFFVTANTQSAKFTPSENEGSLTQNSSRRSGNAIAITAHSNNNNNNNNEVIVNMKNNNNNKDEENGNFLLPRAMLKYQSVGNSAAAAANSMPLAANTATHTVGIDRLLHQNGNSCNSNNNNSSNATNINHNNKSKKSMMMTTTTNNTSNNTSINANILRSSSNIGNMNNINNKTRLNYTNSNNVSTGFLIVKKEKESATATDTSTAALTTTTRNKKQSTSSTITSTSTNTSSVVSVEHELQKPPTIAVAGIHDSSRNKILDKTKFPLSSSSTNANAGNNNSSSAIIKRATAAAAAENIERRGRTSSHSQSHYSTDKSGSSGYYSSNVCSTYSLEDHIYCEPVVDILDLSSKSKSVVGGSGGDMLGKALSNNITASHQQPQQHPTTLRTTATATTTAKLKTLTLSNKVNENVAHSNSRNRGMNSIGQSKRFSGEDCNEIEDDDDDDDDDENDVAAVAEKVASNLGKVRLQINLRLPYADHQHHNDSQHFSENLRVLETSIENLDRHLKNFPSLSSQERIVSFVQQAHTHNAYLQHAGDAVGGEKLRGGAYHLPTIMEVYDPTNQTPPPRTWQESADIMDDSLLDIDLDSFLLVDERRCDSSSKHLSKLAAKQPAIATNGGGANATGIDNPTFLTDEQEENNYKCVKYINSCPEDAYRVDSDIVVPGGGAGGTISEKSASVDHYLKRYEDQLHFQSTRELLEDVRDKIRLLSQSAASSSSTNNSQQTQLDTDEELFPKELKSMIKALKHELESYLDRMNQHSELEIRQLCSGLVKNQNIVKMKKAFERRRSTISVSADCEYEAIRDGMAGGLLIPTTGVPISIRQQITSIRCASDPNFKMKRKSLTEVFPVADCYVESLSVPPQALQTLSSGARATQITQLQRNLSFHQPILNQLDTQVGPNGLHSVGGGGLSSGSGAESGESAEKDSILEWHRKKPSIWEMYYGTNRMNQSLLGKRMAMSSTQATMSYPSSRPESDFTLDLPRAEQLRIKMAKEKKFRQRCRYITTFLSLIFFLLTVMVVSLVLSRGKRMFGSMI